MDLDQLKKWFEMAQQFNGKDFWDDVFNEPLKGFNSENPEHSGSKRRFNPSPQEYPPIDILRSDKELLIIAEVPSYKKEEIEIYIEDKQLVMKGNHRPDYNEFTFIKSERNPRPFQRIIGLPNRVDLTKVSSFMENGNLFIAFPLIPFQGRKVVID